MLLICDEVGFLPLDRLEADLFFQVVSARYERSSTVVTIMWNLIFYRLGRRLPRLSSVWATSRRVSAGLSAVRATG